MMKDQTEDQDMWDLWFQSYICFGASMLWKIDDRIMIDILLIIILWIDQMSLLSISVLLMIILNIIWSADPAITIP